MPTPGTTAHNPALAALAERHATEWRIWRSQGSAGMPGAFYATRRRPLTQEEAEAQVPVTLAADTVDELAALLSGERHHEGL